MKNTEILSRLIIIFREVFDNSSIQLSDNTNASHIEEWDSLSNIELIVAIEKEFGVRFNSSDIEQWNNVGDICKAIAGKSITRLHDRKDI